LADLPMVTRTAQGIPGDPINVGLIGDEKELLCAMNAAGWFPADPVTFRSSIEIAGSVLLDRAYKDAPVSNLFYLGRREDLAFEKPEGNSADRRHHVRFWKALDQGQEKRPVWLGAVTFDKGVGVSHFTGAITHHIDADLDAERQLFVTGLEGAGMVSAKYQVTGVGPTMTGRNGGGDPYYTDGEVWTLRLVEDCHKQSAPVTVIPSPPATELKDQIWHGIADALGKEVSAP
jgi:LssY C-terminus